MARGRILVENSLAAVGDVVVLWLIALEVLSTQKSTQSFDDEWHVIGFSTTLG